MKRLVLGVFLAISAFALATGCENGLHADDDGSYGCKAYEPPPSSQKEEEDIFDEKHDFETNAVQTFPLPLCPDNAVCPCTSAVGLDACYSPLKGNCCGGFPGG